MARTIVIVGAAVAVAAAGVTGFWFWNRAEAKQQIELSLEALQRAGVETRHDGIDVVGFPIAYNGKIKNFNATIPAQGVAFQFPVFSAGMSAASVGTVDFVFPPEFTVSVIDASGAPTGEQAFVKSENLRASVRPGEQGGYDLGVKADKLRVSAAPSGPESTNHVAFAAFSANGALASDRAAQNIVVGLDMAAERLEASLHAPIGEEDAPQPIAVQAAALAFKADGDLRAQKARLGLGELSLDAPSNARFDLQDIVLDFDVSAADGFDPGALATLGLDNPGSPGAAFAQLLALAAQSILEGGAVESAVQVGALTGELDLDGPQGKQRLSLEGKQFGYRMGLSPERLGAEAVSETMAFAADGAQPMRYDVVDGKFALQLDAADKFDFPSFMIAGMQAEPGPAILQQLLAEIAKGGKATLTSASGRYETISALPAELELPFEKLISRAGKNHSELSLTREAARVSIDGEEIAYETIGAVAGSATNDRFHLSATLPTQAAEAAQPGAFRLTLDGVTMNDALWAMIDPRDALTREIKTLDVSGRVDLLVTENLYALPPGAPPPYGFQKVSLDTLALDLLGFRGDAQGEVNLSPAPDGAVTVRLQRWRELLAALAKTPLGKNPQAGMSMLIAANWIETYGAAGETEDETVLKIDIDPETGVQINGKPLQ